MLITSCGRGVHQRELKGADYLSTSLPDAWYGFSPIWIWSSIWAEPERSISSSSPITAYFWSI